MLLPWVTTSEHVTTAKCPVTQADVPKIRTNRSSLWTFQRRHHRDLWLTSEAPAPTPEPAHTVITYRPHTHTQTTHYHPHHKGLLPGVSGHHVNKGHAQTGANIYNAQHFSSAAYRKQDAVGDSRLRPRCCHLANWTKHTRRLWFLPIRSIMWKHDIIHKTRST